MLPTLLNQLRTRQPAMTSSQWQLGALSLMWGEGGLLFCIDLKEQGQHLIRIAAGELASIQLSQSRRTSPRSWLARTVGRRASSYAMLHARFRAHGGTSLVISARCQSEFVTDLALLDCESVEISLDALLSCIETAMALGAQLVKGPAKSAQPTLSRASQHFQHTPPPRHTPQPPPEHIIPPQRLAR